MQTIILNSAYHFTKVTRTWKQRNFKRDYECTNIKFQQRETTPGEGWIECNEDEIDCGQLYLTVDENGKDVRKFGYL